MTTMKHLLRLLNYRTLVAGLLLVVLFTLLPVAEAAANHMADLDALRMDELDQPAPLLGLNDGKTLADYRGQWMLLHFWATWCGPCARELPGLDRLSQRWQGRPLNVFVVSIDEDGETTVPAFFRAHDIHLPALLFRKARAPEAYWGWGVPVTYLINPEGQLVGRAMGTRDWDAPEIDQQLEGMIGASAQQSTALSKP
jgi:thiol-disulfide isomerase/thioredoxin